MFFLIYCWHLRKYHFSVRLHLYIPSKLSQVMSGSVNNSLGLAEFKSNRHWDLHSVFMLTLHNIDLPSGVSPTSERKHQVYLHGTRSHITQKPLLTLWKRTLPTHSGWLWRRGCNQQLVSQIAPNYWRGEIRIHFQKVQLPWSKENVKKMFSLLRENQLILKRA